jgi:hypothetical protein
MLRLAGFSHTTQEQPTLCRAICRQSTASAAAAAAAAAAALLLSRAFAFPMLLIKIVNVSCLLVANHPAWSHRCKKMKLDILDAFTSKCYTNF